MHGFGNLKDMDKWKEFTALTEAKDLVDMKQLTDEQEAAADRVVVPTLDTDEYKASGSAGNKASGSAGNTPVPELKNEKEPQLGAAEDVDDDEIEPQMDGIGGLNIGGSIRKEMARTEAFEGDETVDDESMETAKDRTTEAVMEKVDDIFTEMFGKSYQEKAKEKDYDLDTTTPVVVMEEPRRYKNIKKGW